ncbi:ABC transporter ATP-binding protein [Acetobacterium woodii]|uniref:Lipid A ABC transport system ATP-binding protein MsbA2 n=1 Tax=Acetobacterium woodii (strain ATCC 29683 / DSM 1030 / JCM 2381 / KCTC 1655 / WB1) TaxID=931626 RepID=H6LBA8_ACEWD|nr:ABC transporter ATP-binding protein [Acetobacterium woodii]AFA47660.1 lipid A ABC transport system ATP-binding protein MsbA2 [Acetobacterium woodii DSM 1030]
MIKYFQNKYALSTKGAKDLFYAIIWTIIMEFSFMAPVVLGFMFLDQYTQVLFNSLEMPKNNLTYYFLISVVLFLVMFGITYFQYQAAYTKTYEESAKSRINLAETLRKLPLAFFGKKDIADLSSTIMEDATQIETLFSHAVPQIYASVITIFVMGIMMFFYNWQLSLAVFWVVPVAALVFYLSRKYQSTVHSELYQSKRVISDKMQEGLDSAQEIKSYNQETAFSKELGGLLDQLENDMIRGELVTGAVINLSYVLLKLGLPSVMLYGAYLLAYGTINVFAYLAFMVIAARIYNPIMEVMNNLALLLYLNVRIERMKEMAQMPKQEGIEAFNPQHYHIEFKNVGFSYQDNIETLKNVSFTARQGEVTALVGPSGGGKSTIAKLAARFWDIEKGAITLGENDISQVDPEALLNHYSIVFQDVTLFNASVMENIRLGKKDASDVEVIKAAQLAQCDEFVKQLPQGYETRIGENGEKLSGGERQRISIARAILKDAPIILLDEATASLDAENESKIQSALGELVKNKTVLIIAHRMRTVLGADKIVVIKDGEIVETGKPQVLKEKKGVFASMLKAQYEQI